MYRRAFSYYGVCITSRRFAYYVTPTLCTLHPPLIWLLLFIVHT
jgi:hypothetical protein